MNRFVELSYHALGRVAEKDHRNAALQRTLLQADWPMRAAAYRAALWSAASLAGLVGLAIGALIVRIGPPAPLALQLAIACVVGASLAGAVVATAPILLRNAAKEREKDIDEALPHALNYMLALANAGLPPREIWASVSRAPVFGAMAEEAARIRRDLDLFGKDLLEAMRDAQERTPSKRFNEFLQGAISAFQSGVELESYLRNKGDQYQREALEKQLQDIDTMGLLAEAFLVVVVAAPLFLIVLLTVMTINQGEVVITYGFLMSLVFIPLTQIIIGAVVKSLNPRAWT